MGLNGIILSPPIPRAASSAKKKSETTQSHVKHKDSLSKIQLSSSQSTNRKIIDIYIYIYNRIFFLISELGESFLQSKSFLRATLDGHFLGPVSPRHRHNFTTSRRETFEPLRAENQLISFHILSWPLWPLMISYDLLWPMTFYDVFWFCFIMFYQSRCLPFLHSTLS